MTSKVAITGSDGFMGKNLRVRLAELEQFDVIPITRSDDENEIRDKLKNIHCLFHLAGANRPERAQGFITDNVEYTERILKLASQNKAYKLIFTSSTQAVKDNDYGRSKLEAEKLINEYQNGQHDFSIYRLPNVFGKWGKPNYNSGVITFCYNASRELPIEIHDPGAEVNLVYIDDVINHFIEQVNKTLDPGIWEPKIEPIYQTTVGELAKTIKGFKNSIEHGFTPDFNDPLVKKLYSTYVSYMDPSRLSRSPVIRSDERGVLFELLKNTGFGQIFISHTEPNVVRGNHYHHSKVEKFCIIQGEGLIKFRSLEDQEVIEYRVSGNSPQIIEIPPGYTHNLTNIGNTSMITLFWANEIFDSSNPDTIKLNV